MGRITTFCTYFYLIAGATILCSSCANVPEDAPLIARQPNITPDYADIVFPSNIAPLNFAIDEEGDNFAVGFSGESGHTMRVSASDREVRIPEKAWKTLLRQNRGKRLSIVVYVYRDNKWHKFKPIRNTIAKENIDSHLAYRWMRNLHHAMKRFYLMQRSLESFEESTVLDNKSIGGGCMNCHTFLNGRTDTMLYQIRSKKFGLPMVLVKDDKVTPVNTRTAGFSKSPASFSSWHPSRKRIAFSVNKVAPFEHTVGHTRGEWDNDSDLAVYNVDKNTVSSTPGIADPLRRETFPAWSADGERLYFSSAPQLPFNEFRKVQYDLMQIPFNPTSEKWGAPQVAVSAKEANISAVEPRVSPDSKWVLFAGTAYGQMACYLPSSDLYILNVASGEYRKLAFNSDQSDSWPTWSSNGRWITFASKRRDGLLTHVYFSYFDEDGKIHKPFILPQEDPRYYDSCVNTYNKPELAVEPIAITGGELAKGICDPEKKLEPSKTFNRADLKAHTEQPGYEELGQQ